MCKAVNVLGYFIDCSYPLFPNTQKKIINTLNPHSYCVAKRDEKFRDALKASDLLIPDGTGIVLAVRILKGRKIERIAGADMHLYLLKQAEEYGLKVFYMGASKETLSKIETRIHSEYPRIRCESYSPPYKSTFNKEDNRKMCEVINAFCPDILFVGMTAPKQEKWVHQNEKHIKAKVICSIGAVFDFYAGTVQRSSPFWINLGLEWLPRLLKQPKRLWRRNFVSTPIFIWDVFKAKLLGS